MSAPVTLTTDDLWGWLSQENPVLANIAGLYTAPTGARLLPEVSPAKIFSQAEALQPTTAPPGSLELLLVDSIFGTEELASYSKHVQLLEESPRLLVHPEDAVRLDLASEDHVAIQLPGGELQVPIKIVENMAPGVLILPRHRQLAWRLAPDYQVLISYDDLAKVKGGGHPQMILDKVNS
jgi:hypothetical protein